MATETPIAPTGDDADTSAQAGIGRYLMFVGYPRSGHSLVGALLDAHPNIIVAHELDVLELVTRGLERRAIWSAILENSRAHAATGRKWEQYAYGVPGQWNGRFGQLRVIGDKKGGRSTLRLAENPELLGSLRRTMEVRCQFVHVIRNPYDNISSIARRTGAALPAAIDDYLRRCEFIAAIRGRVARADWYDLRHERLVADVASELRKLCMFVGEVCDEQYLADCAGVVFPRPRWSRREAPWTRALVREVDERMARFAFLGGYAFDN